MVKFLNLFKTEGGSTLYSFPLTAGKKIMMKAFFNIPGRNKILFLDTSSGN